MSGVVVYLVQLGAGRLHSGQMSLIAPLAFLAFVLCIGAIGVPLLGMALSGSRSALRSWRGRRRRLRAAASAEMRARAMMSELCPHGWQAQITMFSGDAEAPALPGGGQARVALDWAELQDGSGRPAVLRRVLAPSIGEALDAMVADRRTDETLEQIERGAVADGAFWPDA